MSKTEGKVVIGRVAGEDIEVDLATLYHPQQKYTPEKKIEVAMTYLTTGGNLAHTSRITNIPESTIWEWKSESQWWDEVYDKVKRAKQEELDTILTHTIHEAVKTVSDRLEKGNKVFHPKTGEEVTLPVDAKAAATIAGILFDKRQLIRGEATSRTATVSRQDMLNDLQSKFVEMAETLKGKTVNATRILEHSAAEEVRSH